MYIAHDDNLYRVEALNVVSMLLLLPWLSVERTQHSAFLNKMKKCASIFRCLREHHLDPFPQSHRNIPSDGCMKTRADFPVYCICRMPEMKDVSIVECEECFVHTVDEELLDRDIQWLCHSYNNKL